MLEASAAVTTTGAVTDKQLGKALIERRPEAMPAAWRRYYPMVHRMLRRALGAQADIEDVVQEVFLSLFRSAPALRDSDALRPFVIGITRHTLRQEYKRKTRRLHLAAAYHPLVDNTPFGSGPATSYAIIKLKRLLLRLTEQERASLVFRFGHGMTVTEVAEALGVSEPTAKRRLLRARESLCDWAARDPFLRSYVRGQNISLIAGMDC